MTARGWLNLYWLVAGALLGFSVIGFDLLPIIWPVTLIAIAMVIFGAIRWHGGGAWWAVIGLGGVPLFFLLVDIYGNGPTCPPGGLTIPAGGVPPGGAMVAECHGPIPELYYVMAGIVGAITLAGIVGATIAAARRSK